MKERNNKLLIIATSLILLINFVSAGIFDGFYQVDSKDIMFVFVFGIVFAIAKFSLGKIGRGQRGFPATIIALLFALATAYFTVFRWNIGFMMNFENLFFNLTTQMGSFLYWGGPILFIGSWIIAGLFMRTSSAIIILGIFWAATGGIFIAGQNNDVGVFLIIGSIILFVLSFVVKAIFPPQSERMKRTGGIFGRRR